MILNPLGKCFPPSRLRELFRYGLVIWALTVFVLSNERREAGCFPASTDCCLVVEQREQSTVQIERLREWKNSAVNGVERDIVTLITCLLSFRWKKQTIRRQENITFSIHSCVLETKERSELRQNLGKRRPSYTHCWFPSIPFLSG
jgi:hypothetical protein